MRSPAPHVVPVVPPAVVIGDEPRVGLGLELAGRGEVTAVEGRTPALLEDGAVESLAARRCGWATGPGSARGESLGHQVGPEAPGATYSGPLSLSTARTLLRGVGSGQHVVDEADGVGAVDRSEHDHHDRPPGEDVDGG